MAITHASGITLADELNEQMWDSDEIDIVVSFIKMAGLNLLLDGLFEHSQKKRVRIITTAYMGNTEFEAIDTLINLKNTELRMELDAGTTRLHAKCFIFRRDNGRSTAYVGSANISKTALTTGEEWVVKIREQDCPEIIRDLENGFKELWNSNGVEKITRKSRAIVEKALERMGN